MFRDLFRSQGYTNNNSSLDWDWNRIDSASGGGAGVVGTGSDARERVGNDGGQGYEGNMGVDAGKRSSRGY